LTDEILMAFADGELDEPVRGAVEEAMAKDPAIGERVAEYMRSRRLVQSALSTEDHLAVPPALRAAVVRQALAAEGKARENTRLAALNDGAARSATSAGYRLSRMSLRLAASLAAFAVGTGIFFAGRWTGSHEPAGQALVARLDSSPVRRTLSAAVSGQQHDLEAGQFRAIATYRSGNGGICREFTLQDASGKANAVACRSNSDWNVTFALVEPAQTSGYAPADGSDLIGAYLQKVNAGGPLEPPSEREALSKLPN
jgi:hypothetical protein